MRGQQVLLSGSLSHSHGSGSGVPVVAQVNEPELLSLGFRVISLQGLQAGLYRGCVGFGVLPHWGLKWNRHWTMKWKPEQDRIIQIRNLL